MNTDMDIDINAVTGTDTITCRLVEARADLGITQKELATATGISLKTIANIEAKQHIPSLLYAMRIAGLLPAYGKSLQFSWRKAGKGYAALLRYWQSFSD